MDLTKMTRAQAERLAASTTDEDLLKSLAGHKNSHVKAKASRKLVKLEEARDAFERARTA